MDLPNDTQSSFPKKKRYLRVIALIANLLGYGILFWCDWRIALGIFFLFFALNLRLQWRDEEIKKNNFEKLLKEILN